MYCKDDPGRRFSFQTLLTPLFKGKKLDGKILSHFRGNSTMGLKSVVGFLPRNKRKKVLKRSHEHSQGNYANMISKNERVLTLQQRIPHFLLTRVLSKPFSHKKLETIFFTPSCDTPFLVVVFTLHR